MYLHPGRKALLYAGEQKIGEIGEMHPDVAAWFGISERIYVAELSFHALFELHSLVMFPKTSYILLTEVPRILSVMVSVYGT